MPLVTQAEKDKAAFDETARVWLAIYCAAISGRSLQAEQEADAGLRAYQRKFY